MLSAASVKRTRASGFSSGEVRKRGIGLLDFRSALGTSRATFGACRALTRPGRNDALWGDRHILSVP
jgi:hypothetical protein